MEAATTAETGAAGEQGECEPGDAEEDKICGFRELLEAAGPGNENGHQSGGGGEVGNVEHGLDERFAMNQVSQHLSGKAGNDQPRGVHKGAAGEDGRFAPADREPLTAMPERQTQQLTQSYQKNRYSKAPQVRGRSAGHDGHQQNDAAERDDARDDDGCAPLDVRTRGHAHVQLHPDYP